MRFARLLAARFFAIPVLALFLFVPALVTPAWATLGSSAPHQASIKPLAHHAPARKATHPAGNPHMKKNSHPVGTPGTRKHHKWL